MLIVAKGDPSSCSSAHHISLTGMQHIGGIGKLGGRSLVGLIRARRAGRVRE